MIMSQRAIRYILFIALLQLFHIPAPAQVKVITIDRINNQKTLDDVLESYEEMLTENDDEDELTNALSDILKIKLNYPAGNYEAIYDAAKDIKVKAKNPDLAFKAAMLLRLLRADVSAELIARLNAMDLAEVWDTIAAEVY
jgi:hypothetical protein